MGDEEIVDRIAREIFLAERNIESSDAEIQPAVVIEPAAKVFEIQIQFADAQIVSALFTGHDVHFGEEIDVVPQRRFEEELGLVNGEFFVRKLTFPSAIKEGDASFPADVELAEIVWQPGSRLG